MEDNDLISRQFKLPQGYAFISLEASDKRRALTLGILVRKERDPVAGHLITLRQTSDADVLLGAVCDGADRIIELVELWVQSFDRIDSEKLGFQSSLNNVYFDSRWNSQLASLAASAPVSYVDISASGLDNQVLVLDVKAGKALPLQELIPASKAWELCRDEATLELARLPGYADSLARYLYQPADSVNSDFIPLTRACVENEFVKPLEELAGMGPGLVSFNPSAGKLAVRKMAHMDLQDFAALLGGEPWKGLDAAKSPMLPEGISRTLQEIDHMRDGGEHLFRSDEGLGGRITEAFYLKIALWEELFTVVQDAVRRLQTPFYSLQHNSFRIRLAGISSHLPYLWAFRAELSDTPNSFLLPTLTQDTRFFKVLQPSGFSVYKPEAMTESLQSTGSLRLRKLRDIGQGEVVLEGTLATNERIEASKSDLVFIRIPLQSQSHEVFAQISAEDGLAQGELRFTTLGQAVTPDTRDALLACEGVPLPRVPFELMPVMRTPCDVYSLAVIGVEMLLVNSTSTLPVALHESLSLAREIAVMGDRETPLQDRIRKLLDTDPRWRKSLGPHCLLSDELTPEDARKLMPEDVWVHFLAVLIRLFPGVGPDSCHEDFGAVSPFALENAFDEPLEEIRALRIRAKSLLFTDWAKNDEIGQILAQFANSE